MSDEIKTTENEEIELVKELLSLLKNNSKNPQLSK